MALECFFRFSDSSWLSICAFLSSLPVFQTILTQDTKLPFSLVSLVDRINEIIRWIIPLVSLGLARMKKCRILVSSHLLGLHWCQVTVMCYRVSYEGEPLFMPLCFVLFPLQWLAEGTTIIFDRSRFGLLLASCYCTSMFISSFFSSILLSDMTICIHVVSTCTFVAILVLLWFLFCYTILDKTIFFIEQFN